MRIHARRLSPPDDATRPPIQVVVNGEVIRSSAKGTIDFELPAVDSMWVAARTESAHTTPIYITVDGRRHWSASVAPALIKMRLATLDEIERLIDGGGKYIGAGIPGSQESPESFRASAPALRKTVEDAREAYRRLETSPR